MRAYRVEYIGDGREVYLVLEWVAAAEGKRNASLRAWLAPGKPLTTEQALLFALHVTRGMKHAARKIPGVVHRDLKPENVLVGRDGNARVTDFGLAKTIASLHPAILGKELMALGVGQTQLPSPIVAGTPAYMAPEQWTGEPLDARADMYAFGCILYDMITGEMAVAGKDVQELAEAHLTGRVRELPRGLPGEVSAVVRRCLAVSREGRYGSWEELEEAVGKADWGVAGKEAPGEMSLEGQTRVERVAVGWSYNAMGRSYFDIGKYEAAVGYYERAVQIGEAEKERALEGVNLGNLGNAYASLGELRRAVECYEQSLAIAREIGDRHGEGRALGSLGIAYAGLGEVGRAIRFYEQDLAIAREIGDVMGEAITSYNVAKLLVEQGRRAEALRHAELAAQRFAQLGHAEYVQRAQQLVARIRDAAT